MRIKPNRISWDEANSLYEIEKKELLAVLNNNDIEVYNISPAGSLRRGKKSIGDLDIVIEVSDPNKCGQVLEEFLKYKYFHKGSFYKGKAGSLVVDLFIAGKYNYFSMLFFLTGSEAWNIKIMKYLNLNTKIRFLPFKFFDSEAKKEIDFNSEEEIFKLLNHSYVKPKNRTPNNFKFGE